MKRIGREIAELLRDRRRLQGLLSGVLGVVVGLLGLLQSLHVISIDQTIKLGVTVGTVAAIVQSLASSLERISKEKRRSERIEEIEREVEQNPQKIRPAWELAQEKLERYLERNLEQVRSIYWLCIAVMSSGFTLVCYGAVIVYGGEGHLGAGVLSSVSGVLISFMGGSFLIIYRSTMAQAKDYVSILERINAVGMSLQVIEGLSQDKHELRDKAKADLAKELLAMYSIKKN